MGVLGIGYIPLSLCVSMPERGLHAELKEWLREPGDLVEGTVWDYRADIIRGDLLIEIQTGNFPQIRAKLAKLLKGYRVRLVHPVPERRWVIREIDGKRQRRVSPHVGRVEEVFNELVYCPTLPLDPNFSMEVTLVHAEEKQTVRWRGKRRTRYTVTERHLVEVVGREVFEQPSDYDEITVPSGGRSISPLPLCRMSWASQRYTTSSATFLP